MDSIGFMESMVQARGTYKEECYKSFAWRKNYLCQIHGLREKKYIFKLGEIRQILTLC